MEVHRGRFYLPVPVNDRGIQTEFPHDVHLSINSKADGTAPSADTSDLSLFCEACKKIINDTSEFAKPCSLEPPKDVLRNEKEGVKLEFVHHENGGRGLRDAASSKCPLCVHIWLSLSIKEREDICESTSNTGFAESDFATRYQFVFSLSPKGFKNCIMRYSCRRLHRSEMNGMTYISFEDPVEKQFRIIPCPGKGTILNL
jgi:hypothetical protein